MIRRLGLLILIALPLSGCGKKDAASETPPTLEVKEVHERLDSLKGKRIRVRGEVYESAHEPGEGAGYLLWFINQKGNERLQIVCHLPMEETDAKTLTGTVIVEGIVTGESGYGPVQMNKCKVILER